MSAAKRHLGAQQLAQARGDRRERELRVGLALGAAQVGAHDDLAPGPASPAIVGTLARMRPSSVMTPSSSGTFRSARTSTRLPATCPSARSSIVFIAVLVWIGTLRSRGRASEQGP